MIDIKSFIELLSKATPEEIKQIKKVLGINLPKFCPKCNHTLNPIGRCKNCD